MWKGREEKGSVGGVRCVSHSGKGMFLGEATFRLVTG